MQQKVYIVVSSTHYMKQGRTHSSQFYRQVADIQTYTGSTTSSTIAINTARYTHHHFLKWDLVFLPAGLVSGEELAS